MEKKGEIQLNQISDAITDRVYRRRYVTEIVNGGRRGRLAAVGDGWSVKRDGGDGEGQSWWGLRKAPGEPILLKEN